MAARQILFQLTRYTVPCTASQSNLESSLKINITLSQIQNTFGVVRLSLTDH